MPLTRSQRARAVFIAGCCCLPILVQPPVAALFRCSTDIQLDAKERFLDEIRALHRFLPPGAYRRTVGYHADPAGFRRAGLSAVRDERLCLLQYELAPFAIDETHVRPWVICDSDNPAYVPWWADEGWTLVTQLSNGTKLFRRAARN